MTDLPVRWGRGGGGIWGMGNLRNEGILVMAGMSLKWVRGVDTTLRTMA